MKLRQSDPLTMIVAVPVLMIGEFLLFGAIAIVLIAWLGK